MNANKKFEAALIFTLNNKGYAFSAEEKDGKIIIEHRGLIIAAIELDRPIFKMYIKTCEGKTVEKYYHPLLSNSGETINKIADIIMPLCW